MPLGKFFDWLGGDRGTARSRLPDALWDETLATLPFVARLDAGEKTRLRQLVEAFLGEKEFTTAGDLELTDAMCVSIAVQGCLPILNLGLECYRDWVGIVIYPGEFIVPRSVEDEFGVVHEYTDVASGEAWEGGPLLVSWDDAQMAGDGYNVVIHEFAHKLDMRNGEVDGVPPLPPGLSRQEWEDTLHDAYDDFCALVDAAEDRGELSESSKWPCESLPFDPYAAENAGEFFAVMSESFFEQPRLLRQHYPVLYANFARFYRQDPAASVTFGSSPR